MGEKRFQECVRQNCNISDARDNGVFSICTLVLKLRNQYKWENGLEPWQEPESAVLLDWIADREAGWNTLTAQDFEPVVVNGSQFDPFDAAAVNHAIATAGLCYGAGYGRSMKAVFFLAEISAHRLVAGCPVIIMGRELARELASPFAMVQDGIIYIRREALRYYFWDQLQEISPSGRCDLRQAMRRYGLEPVNGVYQKEGLVTGFEDLIDRELEMFIHHEVGEILEDALDSKTLQQFIAAFPHSPIEFLARAQKDILADCHPQGLLAHIIAEEKESSLGFYAAFLDGIRKVLFPELGDACRQFWENGDWLVVDAARETCRTRSLERAAVIRRLCGRLAAAEPAGAVAAAAEKELLTPLGLQRPA